MIRITNFKIYDEREKAIETAWIFKDPEEKEFLHLTWVPKKCINKDGSVHKGFMNDKLFEIQCKYCYKIDFIGIEEQYCTVEREIRTGAKRHITYKVYKESDSGKAVLLNFILTLLNKKVTSEKIWVAKAGIDEFGIKDWMFRKIMEDLDFKYQHNKIVLVEIEEEENVPVVIENSVVY